MGGRRSGLRCHRQAMCRPLDFKWGFELRLFTPATIYVLAGCILCRFCTSKCLASIQECLVSMRAFAAGVKSRPNVELTIHIPPLVAIEE